MADRNHFVHEKCIDKGNRFIIHTGEPTVDMGRIPPLILSWCNTAVSRYPLKHVENSCQHSCMAAKIAHIFPKDNEFGDDDGSWCESGGETTGDDSDNDGVSVESSPHQANNLYL